MVKYDVRKNTYYDSVTLMLISKEIKKIKGVTEALVGMGTDLNKMNNWIIYLLMISLLRQKLIQKKQ